MKKDSHSFSKTKQYQLLKTNTSQDESKRRRELVTFILSDGLAVLCRKERYRKMENPNNKQK